MTDPKPALAVVAGGRTQPAPRIAFSLVVHERKRLDIPLHAVVGVEASATYVAFDGNGPVSFDRPHVELRLAPPMQEKLRLFTQDIVGEMMEIHVRDRCVSRAVIREPLGQGPSLCIAIGDFPDAQALADVLRTGWRPVSVVDRS